MDIRDSDTDSATGSSMRRYISIALASTIAFGSTATAFAKQKYVSYMGSNPDICGTNPRTGKANLCSKDIPLAKYLKMFPGAAGFYEDNNLSGCDTPVDRTVILGQIQSALDYLKLFVEPLNSYTPDDVAKLDKLVSKMSNKDMDKILDKVFKGIPLSKSERKILRGVIKYGHWFADDAQKYGVDIRIVLLFAIIESKITWEIGDSGKSHGPMQIQRPTMAILYKAFKDRIEYFIKLKKQGKDPFKDPRAVASTFPTLYMLDIRKTLKLPDFEHITALDVLTWYTAYNTGQQTAELPYEPRCQERNAAISAQFLTLEHASNYANIVQLLSHMRTMAVPSNQSMLLASAKVGGKPPEAQPTNLRIAPEAPKPQTPPKPETPQTTARVLEPPKAPKKPETPKMPEPAKKPEPTKKPEPARAQEPPKTPEPIKVPEAPKPIQPVQPKLPIAQSVSDVQKSAQPPSKDQGHAQSSNGTAPKGSVPQTPLTETKDVPKTTARVLEPERPPKKESKPAEPAAQQAAVPVSSTHVSTQTALVPMSSGKGPQPQQTVNMSTKTVELAHKLASANSIKVDKSTGTIVFTSSSSTKSLPLLEVAIDTHTAQPSQQIAKKPELVRSEVKTQDKDQPASWENETDRKLNEMKVYLAKSRSDRDRNSKQMQEMFRAMTRR